MRCVTVLGPSGSGKTTLVEKLASLEAKPIRQSSQYGVSVSRFDFMGERWAAIDTPGSNESLAHAQNALMASDAAILCVSPDPSQAVLAAPYLKAIEASGTPCILFVNRIDEPRGRIRDVIAALQDYAAHTIVLRQIPIREGDRIVGAIDLISERAWRYREGQSSTLVKIPDDLVDTEHEARAALLEHLSEFDDWLLEELVEDHEPASAPVYEISKRVLRETRVIPAMLGAASHMNGIMRLMKALRHEAPSADVLRQRLAASGKGSANAVLAASFHAFHRPNIGKTIWLRVLAPGVRQGATLAGGNLGSLHEAGPDSALPSGDVAEGQLVSAVKSDHLPAPGVLSRESVLALPAWTRPPTPMVARVLHPQNEKDEAKLPGILAKLAETDNGMMATQEEGTGAQLVRAQGPLHFREICNQLAEVFRIPVREGMPVAVYRETVIRPADVHYRHKKQTGGAGQFADVRLIVRPNARGAGFAFEETVKGGAVPRNFIPAVEAGARESMARGPLGFPVIDVTVTLTDGQHHAVDSSEHAFRTAARMGVQEALAQASPVLMQPVHQVEFHIPSIYSGALVPIVSSFRGQVLGFDRDASAKGWDVFRALLPGSVLDEMVKSLRSATQGIGYFDSSFDHFEELYGKEAEHIVAAHR